MEDIIKEALKIANTHGYSICDQCSKKNCKTYCLPVEMFVQLTDEPDNDRKLEMLENISYLFE